MCFLIDECERHTFILHHTQSRIVVGSRTRRSCTAENIEVKIMINLVMMLIMMMF